MAADPGVLGIASKGIQKIGSGNMNDSKGAGEKIGEWMEDTKDRASDKVDEVKADADVKSAEAHKSAVDAKNDVKEAQRDS